jgi:hypothetical protein
MALVILLASAHPAFATTFDVDRIDDSPLAAAQACTAAANDCTLRGAVIKANANGGADTITLQGLTSTLSISGAGEDAAATGDLDITDSVTIMERRHELGRLSHDVPQVPRRAASRKRDAAPAGASIARGGGAP